MNPRAVCLVAIAAALLSPGCGTHYVPPASGPTAKVRIAIDSDDYFVLAATFSNASCKGRSVIGMVGAEGRWVMPGYAESSTLNMLGGTDKPDAKRKERKVVAEQPFTVAFRTVGPAVPKRVEDSRVGSCDFAVTLTPQADRQYELMHSVHQETCHLDVNELSQAEDGTVVRTPVEGVEPSTCNYM